MVRTPLGVSRGNQSVIAANMAILHEFPDRQTLTEDVIWAHDPKAGHLSSHRLYSMGTHVNAGQFGPATGRTWAVRVIADCAARGQEIYDEWLVRDAGGIARQLGTDPCQFARDLIAAEGGAEATK